MEDNDELRRRALVEYTLESNPDLLKSFVQNPQPFLDELQIDEQALVCTDEAHRAVARAEKVRAALQKQGSASVTELLPRASEAVAKAFGEDYTVEKIPFGVRFCEPVKEARLGLTATGSIGIEFKVRFYVDIDG